MGEDLESIEPSKTGRYSHLSVAPQWQLPGPELLTEARPADGVAAQLVDILVRRFGDAEADRAEAVLVVYVARLLQLLDELRHQLGALKV